MNRSLYLIFFIYQVYLFYRLLFTHTPAMPKRSSNDIRSPAISYQLRSEHEIAIFLCSPTVYLVILLVTTFIRA